MPTTPIILASHTIVAASDLEWNSWSWLRMNPLFDLSNANGHLVKRLVAVCEGSHDESPRSPLRVWRDGNTNGTQTELQ